MNDLLAARDRRVQMIETLLETNPIVVSLRCNYPGNNKNNVYTEKVSQYIDKIIKDQLKINFATYYCDKEGPIYLYTLKEDNGQIIKGKTIEIENTHPLGRLVDIDVYDHSIKSLSRSDLNEKARNCYLCDKEAHDCIVSKRHTVDEVIQFFQKTLNQYDNLPFDMIEYTNQAMLYELLTYPSFGLVSPYSNGAHLDMNYYTFIDSISVLNKYMFHFATLGFQDKPIESTLQEAIQIGLLCEQEMFQKTKGINTHKGLIFVLGTLVLASMKALYYGEALEMIFKYSADLTKRKLKELNQLNDNKLSHGEKVYLKYNIEGVRKEASLGFPIIQRAMDILDLENKDTLVKTLVYIMSLCDDTTILHRKGLKGLEYVKRTMINLIAKGFDKELMMNINETFIKEGISPGGSADLLCGTIFISLIKNKLIKRRD